MRRADDAEREAGEARKELEAVSSKHEKLARDNQQCRNMLQHLEQERDELSEEKSLVARQLAQVAPVFVMILMRQTTLYEIQHTNVRASRLV